MESAGYVVTRKVTIGATQPRTSISARYGRDSYRLEVSDALGGDVAAERFAEFMRAAKGGRTTLAAYLDSVDTQRVTVAELNRRVRS